MRLIPIVYVTDMERSARFYEKLGANIGPGGVGPVWTEMDLGATRFALHSAPSMNPGPQRVGLSLLAAEPLEQVQARFEERGIEVARTIADEPFGRSMVVSDPDGLPIQVNEHR